MMFGLGGRIRDLIGRRTKSIILVLAAPALLVSACTSIKTAPDLVRSDLTGIDDSNRATIGGVPYSLPKLQYDLTFTYKLTECDDRGAPHPKAGYYIPPAMKKPYANDVEHLDDLSAEGFAKMLKRYENVPEAIEIITGLRASQEFDDYQSNLNVGHDGSDDDNDQNRNCAGKHEKNKDKNFGDYNVEISLEASPKFIEGERYIIDYDALSSVWNTSVFEIAIAEETAALQAQIALLEARRKLLELQQAANN